MASENLFFYSTNTKLARLINEKFYRGKHYVWCSPVFDPSSLGEYDLNANIPPSSNPHDIYCLLKKDITRRDGHSSKIEENRNGLRKGAAKQVENGVITLEQFGIIIKMIDNASFMDFTPYIYIIRADLVQGRVDKVSPADAANPFGDEFRIFDLVKSEFEIIKISI